MITEGQIVLVRFPQSGQTEAKLRPSLVFHRGRRIIQEQFSVWSIEHME
jgi:hypothetical protein